MVVVEVVVMTMMMAGGYCSFAEDITFPLQLQIFVQVLFVYH